MFERILVSLDGSRFGEVALPHALEIAERLEAGLELVTVANPEFEGELPESDTGAGDDLLELARDHAGAYLESVQDRIRSGGFEGELGRAVIPAGNVAHALARHARDRGCDLAVMSTHGRGPIQRAWLGSAADAFIRRSPVRAPLTRPPEAADDADERGTGEASSRGPLTERASPIARVLLPFDGSEEAERMLDTVAPLLSGDTGGACVLLRVVPPFMPGGSPYVPHVVREVESQAMVKNAAWKYLDGLAESAPCAEVEARVVTDGQAGVAILRVAEDENVDLIAMSTAGRGGVSRMLLGSVADKVVRGARMPVLVHREWSEG